MVSLPSRISDQPSSTQEDFSQSTRIIFDILDVVPNVRDGDHLQCIAFIAQELNLLTNKQNCFLFASAGGDIRQPHSLLLESHLYVLLRDGYIDIDGTGRLRLRRDLYDIPYSGLVYRNLRSISSLSASDVTVFASAVMRLTSEGLHAGSYRHDDSFTNAINFLSLVHKDEYAADSGAICAARRRLLLSEPVLVQ